MTFVPRDLEVTHLESHGQVLLFGCHRHPCERGAGRHHVDRVVPSPSRRRPPVQVVADSVYGLVPPAFVHLRLHASAMGSGSCTSFRVVLPRRFHPPGRDFGVHPHRHGPSDPAVHPPGVGRLNPLLRPLAHHAGLRHHEEERLLPVHLRQAEHQEPLVHHRGPGSVPQSVFRHLAGQFVQGFLSTGILCKSPAKNCHHRSSCRRVP